jgi:histidine triad (HIT) family protein
MKCIFCDIIENKVENLKVWEDENFVLLLDSNPINPGHLLLMPKKHAPDIFNLPDAQYAKLFMLAKKVVPILKSISKAKRIGLAIEGFGVAHVHIHLVPVNKGNELNPLRAKKVPLMQLKEKQNIFIKKFKKLIF